MSQIKDGWFAESDVLNKGTKLSIEVEEIIFQGKSDFQDVLVFKSKAFGTVLVLDGAIQVTERDEFSYQEMIAHLPIGAHPNPKRVLVVGGGDGGVLREIARYPGIEQIDICEIDQMVIDVSKKYLPNLSRGFSDPRVNVHVMDGFIFLKERQNYYDVIITDSSDPVGPAEVLFQKEYFELINGALRPHGIMCSQAESLWYHIPIIKALFETTSPIFPTVDYAFTTIPTYPSGQIGFLLCGKVGENGEKHDFRKPVTVMPAEQLEQLQYYSLAAHEAAFVLPKFASDALSSVGRRV
eukprot:TRINITY_DN4286_c0_g1_i1.p1 TRINITY_DN4286_c0_g1~~TRINITY_DN4286_c0_g1_i1.p1  ORF type:complete len:296 (+),score=73.65 TRINITY_DN4286_c0_g1_i1:63-950(+)